MATRAQPSSLDSLCYNLSTLQQLARQGSWRALIDVISQARKLSLPDLPHEQLVYHAYLVLSHMKLRSFGDASLEIDALSDLDSPQYRYEHYPQLYPHRTGSMVPFVLRWLHAELPYYLNEPAVTTERLYSLYDLCRQRIDQLLASASNACTDNTEEYLDKSQSAPSHQASDSTAHSSDDPGKASSILSTNDVLPIQAKSDTHFEGFGSEMNAALHDLEGSTKNIEGMSESDANLQKRWQHRQEFIINCIVSHHLNQKDFLLVLSWFKELLKLHPSDPWLLSKLGYVQLQMGDLTGAGHTFLEARNIIGKFKMENSEQSSALEGLDFRNRGLQHMVVKQYNEAIKEFDSAILINPVDIISANNKALCCMYNRDLIGSSKILESILDKAPLVALNESLVLNLCSMYELAFVHNVQTKKNLSDWIQQIAPNDFDFSCTRL